MTNNNNESLISNVNEPKKANGSSRKLIEKSLLEIKRLRKQVAALEQLRHGDIAVVGAACRFPGGVNNLEDLWKALDEGRDCISYEGNQHWPWQDLYDENPDAPGKLYTKASGVIDNPIDFDADFFGISPREANEIDPQQRLLMEVSHQAIENGGYSLGSLKGSSTGVFMGIASQDYSQLGSRFGEPEDITPWQGTGVSPSAAAGRLSYLYDFTGPSFAIDTACSSSLVALHYACQSLRQQECDNALVGGVNMILNPGTSILFAKAKMLSVDGQCRTFDKDANGYVRSEGCSVVMLKRLQDAVADGDHIHGVIRGSAVNQDGRSQGLTAPNEISQQKVIQAALKQAKCDAEEVTYVEAHGTGTPLGDPIEINALQAVYGASKAASKPIKVGSAKSNFGHSEAASGMCGLLKLLLTLQNKTIPASLHFSTPNPYVDWASMNVEVTGSKQPWPDAPEIAGLSGFGFTGTNVHVIVESYQTPMNDSNETAESSVVSWYPGVFPLSAKSAAALDKGEALFSEYLNAADRDMGDVCYTLAVGRDHHHYRSARLLSGDSVYAGKKSKAAINSTFQFSSHEVDNTTLSSLRDNIAVFGVASGDVRECVNGLLNDIDEKNEGLFSCAIRALEYQYGLAKTLISWGVTPKLLVSCEFFSIQAEDVGFDEILEQAHVIRIVASEMAAAIIGGLISLVDAVGYLQEYVELCTGKRDSVTEIQCRRPRLQFYSQLVTRDDKAIAFSTDKAAVVTWSQQLAKLTKDRRLTMKSTALIEENSGSDITIVLDDTMSTILSPVLGVSEKKNSVLYARPVQGRTPISTSSPIFQQLENCLMMTYVAGVDVQWSKVFTQHRRLQLPGYAFQRKEYWNPAIPMNMLEEKEAPLASLPNWSYRYEMQPVELLSSDMALPQYWLLIADTKQSANGLYAQLTARGHQCVVLVADGDRDCLTLSYLKERKSPESIGCAEDLRTLVDAIANGLPLNVVLSMSAITLDDDDSAFKHQYEAATTLTLWLGQSLIQLQNMSFWTVTANGLVDGLEKDVAENVSLSQASILLSGFSKSLALELADKMKGHLDYQSATNDMSVLTASAVVDALMSDIPGSNLHYNGVDWCQPLLKRSIIDDEKSLVVPALRDDGFYVIAGGTGSIGLGIAQRLIDRGAKHLVLLSRSGLTVGSSVYEQVETMRQHAQILTPALDITSRDELKTLLAQLRSQLPITGIIHGAGIFDIAPISSLTNDACFSLMDNKVLGLRWLDELTQVDELDMFVGFSSIASVWGSAGNFHYTAANYCVDAIVQRRKARGQVASVINWGPWSGSNMVTDESEVQANKRGLYAMDKELALDWFDRLSMSQEFHQTIVAKIQWSRLKPLLELTSAGALVGALSDSANGIGGDEFPANDADEANEQVNNVELNAVDVAFKNRLAELSPEQAQPELLEYITQQLATALESEVDDVDVFQPLLNLGIDSLMAVEFKNRVTKVTGVEIPLVKLLEGSHLCDLSQMLCDDFFRLQGAEGTGNVEGADVSDDDELFLEGAL